jgi:septum formation protein
MTVTSPKSPKLILASVSPRRKDLLSKIGYPFEILESGVVEDVTPGMAPRGFAEHLASLKAASVAEGRTQEAQITLGADTVIDLDGHILGKPEDPSDAVRMLKELRARDHRVVTAVCLLKEEGANRSLFSVATNVRMRDYSDKEIGIYVESREPMDKAGAYAVQGLGGNLVASVQGCYNNVVGLPLCEVVRRLISLGLPLDPQRAYCRLASGERCPGGGVR